jgi:hypothetical protein
MHFLKQHSSTAIILLIILFSAYWIHLDLKDFRNEFKDIHSEFKEVHRDLASLKSDIMELRREISVMRNIMIMKNVLPKELAYCDEDN